MKGRMSQIRSAQITSFYLFDVAEAINLAAIPGLIGGEAVPARLAAKPARPAYVQYQPPPVSFDGERVETAELGGFRVRVLVYDYGVVSLALNRRFDGSWVELIALGQDVMESESLEHEAKAYCRRLIERLRSAMKAPRDSSLFEDYVVFAIHGLESSPDVRAARRISFGGDRAAAQGRAAGTEPSGERRGAAPPHLVPRKRSRGAFVERGPRLRHRGWRPGCFRDSGVRQLAASGVSLLRRSARQGAHTTSTRSSNRAAGTSSSGRAIPAPHTACTRCSSTSMS